VEPSVEVAAPQGLVEAPLPQEEPPKEAQTPAKEAAPPAPKSPLAALVEEKGLRLSGTLLGPLSVAILESKEGYLVLPAGSPLPGSEAVIRRIESDRVILALKDETLEIPLAGGER
jgi:type II secretory pathway component PulC